MRVGGADEIRRLGALRDYGLLDTEIDPSIDELTQLAGELCDAPSALISLVDADRQWHKARVGFELQQTPRHEFFCTHVVESRDLFVVPDATLDPRFAHSPLVAARRTSASTPESRW